MIYKSYIQDDIRVEIALQSNGPGAYTEAHAMLHLEPGASIESLQAVIARLEASLPSALTMQSARFMVADEAMARCVLDSQVCAHAARTVVMQPPLDGSAAAVWIVWMMEGEYRLLWQGDEAATAAGDSLTETEAALSDLERELRQNDGSLKDSCHRTWFVVRDIDHNYGGVVKGRNEVFGRLGLTRDTHYIASTGIGGAPAWPHRAVAFSSYSVIGLARERVRYLKAADHMNNTMDYGVAFERGTVLDFPDHRQVLISGTASIDNTGSIVHEGDVERQTQRMIRNVDALISESGAVRANLCYVLVYLRNPEDYDRVAPIITREFGDVPRAIVHAPVCRPGWLVEMECSLLSYSEISNENEK